MDANTISTYNVGLTGDDVKKRLHQKVIFKTENDWSNDGTIYPEDSLLIYKADNNILTGIKLADEKQAASALPFVVIGGQSYWKSLDEETVES